MGNPTVDIEQLFKMTKTIAVVGISDKPDRASFRVARYLAHYFNVLPINPQLKTWQEIPVFASLTEAARQYEIDLVDVFRRADMVMPIIEESIQISAKAIWLQQGIISHDAERRCHEAGISFVMDRCTMIDHARYHRS